MLLVITTISALASLVLGIYTLRFNPKSRTNQYFAAFCFVITAWLFCNYATLQMYSLYLIRLLMVLVALLVLSLLLFTYYFSYEKIEKRVLYFVYVVGTAAAILGFSPLLVHSIVLQDGFAHPVIGIGVYYFVPFSALSVLWSFALLLRVIWKEPERTMRRVQAEWISFGLIATTSIITFFGFVAVNLWETNRFIPIAMVSTLIFTGCTAYAMTRYRFLDVRIVLKKSLIYGGTLALFAAAYVIVVLGGYYQLQNTSDIHPSVWLVAALLLFIVLFESVRVHFKNLLDGWFFREQIDFTKIIHESQHELNSSHELETYVLKMTAEVQEVLRAPVREFFVRQRQYKRFKSFFPQRSKDYVLFSDEAAEELEQKKFRGAWLLSTLQERQLAPAVQKLLRTYNATLYMTVDGMEGELLGIALVGPHKSNYTITKKDLEKLAPVQKEGSRMLSEHLQLQEAIEGAKVMILER